MVLTVKEMLDYDHLQRVVQASDMASDALQSSLSSSLSVAVKELVASEFTASGTEGLQGSKTTRKAEKEKNEHKRKVSSVTSETQSLPTTQGTIQGTMAQDTASDVEPAAVSQPLPAAQATPVPETAISMTTVQTRPMDVPVHQYRKGTVDSDRFIDSAPVKMNQQVMARYGAAVPEDELDELEYRVEPDHLVVKAKIQKENARVVERFTKQPVITEFTNGLNKERIEAPIPQFHSESCKSLEGAGVSEAKRDSFQYGRCAPCYPVYIQ